MKCAVHSEREAMGACVECGLGFCEECRVFMDNKNYCKKCVDKVAKKGNLTNRNPVVAALLSFIIPGTGQIYNGQIGKGFLVFFTSWLILPWVYGVIDAYSVANKINKGEIATKTSSGCLPVFLFIITVPVCISIVSLLAAIAIPNLLRARHNANEAGAIAALRTVSIACESFRSAQTPPTYPANLVALSTEVPPYIDASLSSATLPSTAKLGYFYTYFCINNNQFTCVATPAVSGTTGTRIFFVDDSGAIRLDDARGPPIE